MWTHSLFTYYLLTKCWWILQGGVNEVPEQEGSEVESCRGVPQVLAEDGR